MSELPSDSSGQVEKRQAKIDSPTKMARALGFTQNPESYTVHFREYTKDFPETTVFVLPAEKSLDSSDSKYGEAEQVFVGVQFKGPCRIWERKYSVVSEAFLDWFFKSGGNSQLAEDVRSLEPKEIMRRDWIDKKAIKERGYGLIARIIKEAEALGYFEYQLRILTAEFEKKKTIAEAAVKEFLEAFPEYSLFSNRFNEEETFYAAKPTVKKGKVQAMEIRVYSGLRPDNTGTIEFNLGSMKIDEQGNLTSFFQVAPPVLPSTGKYQDQCFRGDMNTIVAQAIDARKRIQRELRK